MNVINDPILGTHTITSVNAAVNKLPIIPQYNPKLVIVQVYHTLQIQYTLQEAFPQ